MMRETPAYERMDNWVGDMRALAQRKPREYPNIEEALDTDARRRIRISVAEQARHLTIHGVRRNENGTYSWKFDNYTRAHSPYLFNLKDATEIWCADPLPHAAGSRRRVVGR